MTSSEAFVSMTCKELKIELKKHDLPTGGLKKDLVDRLHKAEIEKDLMDRPHEAEDAMLIHVASAVNDSGRSNASFEVQSTIRRSKSAWKLLCVTILCAGLFFAAWHVMLGRRRTPGAGSHGEVLNPQDLSWLTYPEHYSVLDVPASASSEDVRRAYRQKARKWHPDKAATMNINQEILYKATRIIGLSRDILLDPRDRRLYDNGFNPKKCDSSCELCTCSCGEWAKSSSFDRSDRHSNSRGDVVVEGAKTGAVFVLKMALYVAVYSYRLPQCWLWHWDLPLWDKQYCTANPLEPMWSEARSIRERCKLECDSKWYAGGNLWDRYMRDECEKTCKRDYRAKSR